MYNSTWWVFIFLLVPNIDSTLAKDDSSFVAQSSMVAENLRRMERQDDASKPAFESALRKAAATAIIGK